MAIDDPAKRVGLFLDMCEYHIPRLARTEHTGQEGGPIQAVVELTFVEPEPK